MDIDLKPGKLVELSGDRKITLGAKWGEGDLCDLYHATFDGPVVEADDNGGPKNAWERLLDDDGPVSDMDCLLKVARHASDNDLVASESEILQHLYPAEATDEKFYRYMPKVLATLTVRGHQAKLIPWFGEHVSWAEILRAFPDGVDYRDWVWMFKRSLVGLGFAHTCGVIHGAVTPAHVLVHPIDHGAKLIDWSYAVKTEGKKSIKAFPATYKAYVPPEVFKKQFPTPATDIYMTAKCAVALLGGNVEDNSMPVAVPSEIQAFLLECLNESPGMRPYDAWDLHERFDKLLLKLVGKPKYRRFEMPA